MVINSDIKVAYRGDGQTTVFPFSFPYIDKDYICVRILDEETGESRTLTSDYYVDDAAHAVHYPGYAPGQEPPESLRPEILPATCTLTIYRSTEISQLIELGEKFPLPVIESALDKITNILQEHDENIQRSIKVDITSTDDPQSYFNEIIETAKLGLQKATEAIAAAENAAASEAHAAASEANAAASASAALASQQAAALSERHAATSETNAAASETTAVASANSATASQQAAALSAESASTSRLAAESSAGSAADNAAISTSAANTAQNAAATCSEVLPQVLGAASNVATKASAAAASATQAALSANAAETASQTAVNAAADAQDAADTATAAANAAAVSAGAAATSAGQAETANTEAKYYAKITMDKIAESAVGYPSQSGTLEYTGQVQTPTWDVFWEPQKLTITGDTSATDAGTYTISMTPKPTYYWWDDDTTTTKTQTWTIGRAAITTPPSQSGVIVYDGTEQTPTWANYDPAKLTIGGDTAGTEAGVYTATFTPTANYKWADGTTTAKSVTWEISAATVTIPTVTDTSKTYTGAAQAPTITGLDPQTVEIIDDATAINAGSYMITFHLKSPSLIWSDETSNDKSFAWSIGPKTVTAPTVTGTEYTYDGTSKSPTIGSYDTDAILVSGTTEAVGAGNYSVIFSLVSAVNYKWSDETTEPKSVAWAITPATVAVPALSNKSKTYNGSAQSPTVSPYDSNIVEVTGTTTATNAGTYTVTFHLLNPNITWADETTADKTDTWEIAKAAGSLSLSKTSVSLNTSTTSSKVTVTRAGDGAITATSSNSSYARVSVNGNVVTITGVATGSATVTIRVAEGTNYLAPVSQTVSVAVQFLPPSGKTLNQYTWAEIKTIARAGEGDNYFDVGDRKEVILNGTVRARTLSNYKWYCYILGFNHNAAKEGNNTIHFQFGYNALSGGVHTAMTDWTGSNSYGSTSGTRFCMNNTNTNVGGWNSSLMRTTTIPEFRNCLPSELKSVLKAATKYTDNTGNKSNVAANVTATQDDIFLLAEYEIFGSKTYANQYEYTDGKQVQYDFYKSGNSKVMYNDQTTGTAVLWWERSPNRYNAEYFCFVDYNGNASADDANRSRGFAPGFCVG